MPRMLDDELHGRRRSRVTQCKSCRASIVWARTVNGKRMPMDAVPVEEGGEWIFVDGVAQKVAPFDPAGDQLRYTAHWSTCPDADEFRRPRSRVGS